MSELADRAWALLNRAHEVYADSPRATNWLRRHLARFSEPLRVAVLGARGSGRTTLVGALIGEHVTEPPDGRPVTWHHVPAERTHPELTVLDVAPAEDGDESRVVESVGMEADAVLYLVGHPHSSDLSVLRGAQEHPHARVAAVNTLLVLARADELGGGRADALASARRVARRCVADPAVGALCQDVTAVAGLAARGARTLPEDEFEVLTALASAPEERTDTLLLSAARFGADPRRARVLERLGLFGVRVALTLIRTGYDTPAALAGELRRHSGLDELWEAVGTHCLSRVLTLKARSALIALDLVLRMEPRPAAAGLVSDLERTLAGAHELTELRLLAALRSGRVRLPGDLREEAVRLAGGYGTDPGVRIGIDTGESRWWQHTAGALRAWRSYSHSPVFGAAQRHAAETVARTCEELLTDAAY